MDKKQFQAKVRDIDDNLQLERYEKLRAMELDMDLENRASNKNRARSVTVGTAFGGTTEVLMRSDGGRHLWCPMQPVEVIELIHQLAANVGCSADLKPRKDFASWRDWRVSEAEKKHLNGHPPFVNDMAVFQKLGALGYDDEEANKIMDIIANIKSFANENITEPVIGHDDPEEGGPNIMIGKESQLIVNKLALDEHGNVLYTAGGEGGKPGEGKNGKNTMAIEKTVNKRSTKRAARAA